MNLKPRRSAHEPTEKLANPDLAAILDVAAEADACIEASPNCCAFSIAALAALK
ncbi:hypothetical protein [Novosphingobium sp. P6W]|uniref:hypothetical protein n=1 Tax=Novosphingobium sp. P6W TaxID=1609758 RepID=UPI000A5E6D68|nr:hypothetical protein [Novosphingobium sp. P6W]